MPETKWKQAQENKKQIEISDDTGIVAYADKHYLHELAKSDMMEAIQVEDIE
jgi:hypothetical protein